MLERPAPWALACSCWLGLSLGAICAALGQAPPRVAAVPLSPPDVELGQLARDEQWGFEMRLPRGFRPLEPKALEDFRRRMIDVDEEETAGEEDVVKRVQIWKYVDDAGRSITVLGNEPPVAIDTPLQLRTKISEGDLLKGRKVEDFGKLYEVSARGDLTGFLVSRRFALEPARPPTLAEHVAYFRGARRSFLVRYVAPLDRFEEKSPDFLAAVTTFALFGDADRPIVAQSPPKEPEARSPRTIATAVLAVLCAVGLIWWWRAAARGQAAGGAA